MGRGTCGAVTSGFSCTCNAPTVVTYTSGLTPFDVIRKTFGMACENVNIVEAICNPFVSLLFVAEDLDNPDDGLRNPSLQPILPTQIYYRLKQVFTYTPTKTLVESVSGVTTLLTVSGIYIMQPFIHGVTTNEQKRAGIVDNAAICAALVNSGYIQGCTLPFEPSNTGICTIPPPEEIVVVEFMGQTVYCRLLTYPLLIAAGKNMYCWTRPASALQLSCQLAADSLVFNFLKKSELNRATLDPALYAQRWSVLHRLLKQRCV
jgi:hypothetical protein